MASRLVSSSRSSLFSVAQKCWPSKRLAQIGQISPKAFATATFKVDDNALEVERAERTAPASRSGPFVDMVNPFRPVTSLLQMMNTMDRLFDDSFMSPVRSFPASRNVIGRTPWDVMEDDKAFKLRMDMPGLSKEEVKVNIEDGVLVIKGECASENKDDYWSSRSVGSYNAKILLPDNVQADRIKAELKNGVLMVTAPKTEATAKSIDIQVN